VVPQILAALVMAMKKGLRLPLVYNTGGYDALETLALLGGVLDIYIPDMKYADVGHGRRLSGVKEYPRHNRQAVAEMYRQVGHLVGDERGIAVRGLLVRHLVMPAGVAGSAEVLRFVAEEVAPRTYVNVMDQYRPQHRAYAYPAVDRRPRTSEIRAAENEARAQGSRLDGCGLDP